jgi:hypothetical protein
MFQQTMELITGGSISSTFGDGTPVTLGYFGVTGDRSPQNFDP